ncbi:MAG: uncharacterized protein K0S74_799 [Chlamydiales bacterium]|jgi:ankyrin repeat protein|nr:uncharacterized protein [Chlamydiales bacterium]
MKDFSFDSTNHYFNGNGDHLNNNNNNDKKSPSFFVRLSIPGKEKLSTEIINQIGDLLAQYSVKHSLNQSTEIKVLETNITTSSIQNIANKCLSLSAVEEKEVENKISQEFELSKGIHLQFFTNATEYIAELVEGNRVNELLDYIELNDLEELKLNKDLLLKTASKILEHPLLLLAAQNGRAKACEKLIAIGAIKSHKGKALLFAVKAGHTKVCEVLLRNKASTDFFDEEQQIPPLMIAAAAGNVELCRLLLEFGATIKDVGVPDKTALSLALDNNQAQVYNLLDSYTTAALHIEKLIGDKDINNLLDYIEATGPADLRLHKNLLLEWKDYSKCTLLIHAITLGKIKACENLIAIGAHVNIEVSYEYNRVTPLTIAADSGNRDICKLLIEKGADLEAKSGDYEKMTPLMLAARSNNRESCELLLSLGANINAQDERGNTVLMIAARSARKEVCELLLSKEYKADWTLLNDRKETACTLAIFRGNIEVCKLFKDLADVNSQFIAAIKQKKVELCKLYIEWGADISLLHEGMSPLYLAASLGEDEICELLLEKGADIAFRKDGKSVLVVAIEASDVSNRVRLLKPFVKHGADFKQVFLEAFSEKKLDLCINLDRLADSFRINHGIIPLLIKAIKEKNGDDYTFLKRVLGLNEDQLFIQAVEKGDVTTCKLLIEEVEKSADTISNHDSVLIIAARRGHIEICKLLLEKGASIDLKNKEGETALITAVKKENIELCRFFLEQGAKADLANEKEQTPLMISASAGNREIVELLIHYQARVDLQDHKGNTALSQIIQSLKTEYNNKELIKKKRDICNLLIENGASGKKNENLNKAFLDAISSQQTEIRQLLLEKGANVKACLIQAAENNNEDAFRRIQDQFPQDIDECFLEAMTSENKAACKFFVYSSRLSKNKEIDILKLFEDAVKNGNLKVCEFLKELDESIVRRVFFNIFYDHQTDEGERIQRCKFLLHWESLIKLDSYFIESLKEEKTNLCKFLIKVTPKCFNSNVLENITNPRLYDSQKKNIGKVITDLYTTGLINKDSYDPSLWEKLIGEVLKYVLKKRDAELIEVCLKEIVLSPIKYAIRNEDRALIDAVIEYKNIPLSEEDIKEITDIKLYEADANKLNEKNQNPLHYETSLIRMRLWLAAGADINAKDREGNTPLHLAITGRFEILELLLEHGAKPNDVDNNGETPLHKTFSWDWRGSDNTRLQLIEAGTDITLRNKWGKSVINLTAQSRNYNFFTKLCQLSLEKSSIDLTECEMALNEICSDTSWIREHDSHWPLFEKILSLVPAKYLETGDTNEIAKIKPLLKLIKASTTIKEYFYPLLLELFTKAGNLDETTYLNLWNSVKETLEPQEQIKLFKDLLLTQHEYDLGEILGEKKHLVRLAQSLSDQISLQEVIQNKNWPFIEFYIADPYYPFHKIAEEERNQFLSLLLENTPNVADAPLDSYHLDLWNGLMQKLVVTASADSITKYRDHNNNSWLHRALGTKNYAIAKAEIFLDFQRSSQWAQAATREEQIAIETQYRDWINLSNNEGHKPLLMAYKGIQEGLSRTSGNSYSSMLWCRLIHTLWEKGADPIAVPEDLETQILGSPYAVDQKGISQAFNLLEAKLENRLNPLSKNSWQLKEVKNLLQILQPVSLEEGLKSFKNLAHLLGDTWIEGRTDDDGVALEGNLVTNSIKFLESLLKTVLEQSKRYPTQSITTKLFANLSASPEIQEKLETVLEQIKDCLNIAAVIQALKSDQKTYISLSISFRVLVIPAISRRIASLKRGEELLLPIGWIGDNGTGHAMFCKVQNMGEGNYSLTVFNTGSGLEQFHEFITEANKTKYCPFIIYQGLKLDQVADPEFLSALFEPQVAPDKAAADSKYDNGDIYNTFSRFADHRVFLKDRSDIDFITPQRAGICSLEVLVTYLRYVLGKEEYKSFKKDLDLFALENAVHFNSDRLPEKPELYKFFLNTVTKTTLHYLESDITSDQTKNALEILDKIMHDLKAVPLPKKLSVPSLDLNTPLVETKSTRIQSALDRVRTHQIDLSGSPGISLKFSPPAFPIYTWDKNLSSGKIIEQLQAVVNYCNKCGYDSYSQAVLAENMCTDILLEMALPIEESIGLGWNGFNQETALQAQKLLLLFTQYILLGTTKNGPAYFKRIIALHKALAFAYHLGCLIDDIQKNQICHLKNYPISTYLLREKLQQNDQYNLAYDPDLEKQLQELVLFFSRRFTGTTSSSLFNWGVLFSKNYGDRLNVPISNESGDRNYLEAIFDSIQDKGDWKEIEDEYKNLPKMEQEKCNERAWKITAFWCKQAPKPLPQHFLYLQEIALTNYALYNCHFNDLETTTISEIEIPFFNFKRPKTDSRGIYSDKKSLYFELQRKNKIADSSSVPLTHLPFIEKEEKDRKKIEEAGNIESLFNSYKGGSQNYLQIIRPKQLRPFDAVGREDTLSIHKLIQLFKENITLFSQLNKQVFFNLNLFQYNLLTTELEKCSQRKEELVKFLEQGLAELKVSLLLKPTDELTHAYFFLLQTKIRINKYLGLTSRVAFQQLNSELSQIIEGKSPIKTLEVSKMQAWARLTQLLLLNQAPSQLEDSQLTIIINHTAYLYLHKHSLTNIEPTIKYEALRTSQVYQAQLKAYLEDRVQRDLTLNSLFSSLYAIKLPPNNKWEGDFPHYVYQSDSKRYEINIMTGVVHCDGLLLDGLENIYNRKEYQEVFGNKRFLAVKSFATKVKLSSSNLEERCTIHETTEDGHRVQFIHTSSLSELVIRKELALQTEKTFYIYIPHQKIRDLPNFPLQPNKEHYKVWLSEESKNPYLVITEGASGDVVYKINSEGKIRAFGNPMLPSEKEWAYLDIKNTPQLELLKRFEEPTYIAAYQSSPPNELVVTFNRYQSSQGRTLSFYKASITLDTSDANKGQIAEKLVWNEDSQYFVATNQSITDIGDFTKYLVLENSKGQRRALIPQQEWQDLSKNSSLEQEPYLYSCELIDLNKNGRLKPKSIKAKMVCAYISSAYGQYQAALKFLQQAQSLQRYRGDELRLFSWFINLSASKKDYHPNLLALQSYAAYLVCDNLLRFPKENKQKQTKVDTRIENAYGSPKEWELYWAGLAIWKEASGDSSKPEYVTLISGLYRRYLAVSNQVDDYLRVDANILSQKPHPTLLTEREEISWLSYLVKVKHHPQLTERVLNLSSDTILAPQHHSGSYTYSRNWVDLQFEKSDASRWVHNNLPTEQKIIEGMKELQSIYPRTRPTDFLSKGALFWAIAKDGSKEQKQELLMLLTDMKNDPNPKNQALKTILEGAIRNDSRLKSLEKKKSDLAEKWAFLESYINVVKGEYEIAQATNISSEYQQSLIPLIEGLAPLSPQVLPSLPDKGDHIELKNPLNLESSLEAYLDSIVPGYVEIKNNKTEHSTLYLPTSRNTFEAFEQNRQELLRNDYKEGYKKNDAEQTYTIVEENKKNLKPIQNKLKELLNDCEIKQKDLKQEILERLNINLEEKDRAKLKAIGHKDSFISLAAGQGAFAQQSYAVFESLNPHLNRENIDQICNLFSNYLLIRSDKKRCQKLLELYHNIKKTPDHEDHYQEFAAELSQKRVYKLNDSKNPTAFLILEASLGLLLKKDQVESLKAFFGDDPQKPYPNKIVQKIMGGGKTLVIGTLLALMKADGYHLSLLVPPASLYKTNSKDMQARLHKLFGQKAHTFDFDRDSKKFTVPYLADLHHTLVNTIKNRDFLIVPPEMLQSLRNRYHEARQQLLPLYEELANYQRDPSKVEQLKACQASIDQIEQPTRWLKKILSILLERGAATFDEFDSIAEISKEFNYPCGEKKNFDSEFIELIEDLFLNSALDPEIAPVLRLRENKQSLLSEEQYTQIKTRLVDLVLGKWQSRLGITEANKEAALKYVNNKEAELPQDWHHPEKQKEARLLILLHQQVNEWLPQVFKKSTDQHFGRSLAYPDKGIAIPYIANNTPNERAEFASPWETFNKTFLLYLNKGLGRNQIADIIKLQQDKAWTEYRASDGNISNLKETKACKAFEEATGKDLFMFDCKDQNSIAILEEIFSDKSGKSLKFVLDHVATHILSKVGVNSELIYNHFHMLHAGLNSTQGYTGTVENFKTFPDDLTVERDIGTNGKTIDILYRCNDSVRIIQEESLEGILKSVASDNNEGKNYHALIDIGAHFRGLSNLKIAQAVLEFHKENSSSESNIKGILFYDEARDELAFIKEGQTEPAYLPQSDPGTIESQTKLSKNQLFTYYDHRRITGADIQQSPTAYAIVTIGEHITLKEILQGVMRMRQLAKKQHVEFVVPESLKPILLKTIGATPTQTLGIKEIIAFAEFNESTKQYKDLPKAIFAKLEGAYEKYINQRLYFSKDDGKQENEYYSQIHQLFTRKSNYDIYQQYGGKLTYSDTKAYFEAECIKALRYLIPLKLQQELGEQWNLLPLQNLASKLTFLNNSLKKLVEGLDTIIKESIRDLPEKIKQSSVHEGHQESTVEQQLEASREQEQENQQEQLNEVQPQRNPYLLEAYEKKWVDEEFYRPEDQFMLLTPYTQTIPDNLVIWSFKEILQNHSDLNNYRDAIKSPIGLTTNFISTINRKVNLFDEYQKTISEILLTYHKSLEAQNPWRMTVLSLQEAASIKKLLQSTNKEKVQTPLWLFSPDQTLIIGANHSLSDLTKDPKHSSQLNLLFLEVLFISANITKLSTNKWLPIFKEWAKDHREQKRVLFEQKILPQSSDLQEALYKDSTVKAILHGKDS